MMSKHTSAALKALMMVLSNFPPCGWAQDYAVSAVGTVESDADALLVKPDGSLATLKDARWNGSGVLISPCLVLTANHVIFGNTGIYDNSYEHDIRFSSRDLHRRQLLAHVVAHGVQPPPIVENGKWKNEDEFKAEDWVIIRIDQCKGQRRARDWLPLLADDKGYQSGKLVGFYDASLGGAWAIKPRLVVKQHCRVRHSNPLATTNCPSREGMSGGPFITDKRRKVAAIINSNGYGVMDGGADKLKSPTYLLTGVQIRKAMKIRYGCDILVLASSDLRPVASSIRRCGSITYKN